MPDSKVFNMPMEVTSLFENRKGEFVFCYPDSLKPYSVNAPRALLNRMDRDETLHGFRATFKAWATDKTMIQREVSIRS